MNEVILAVVHQNKDPKWVYNVQVAKRWNGQKLYDNIKNPLQSFWVFITTDILWSGMAYVLWAQYILLYQRCWNSKHQNI